MIVLHFFPKFVPLFFSMLFETVVWYSVFVTSGGGSKQLSAVDVAIPYIDVQNNANIQLSQNAALPLGSLLLLHDGKLSADDIYKATSALVTSVSQSLRMYLAANHSACINQNEYIY